MCLGGIITSIENGGTVQIILARSGVHIEEKAYLLTVVVTPSVNSALSASRKG